MVKITVLFKSKQYEIDMDVNEPVEVMRLQLFSLTQCEPERQQILGISAGVLTDDADLSKLDVSPGLFVMMNEKPAESASPAASPAQPNQPYNPYQNKGGQEMLSRLNSNIAHVRMYEDMDLQKKALALIPLDELKAKAKERDTPAGPQDRLLKELLQWFKRDFFTWVNQPKCEACGADTAAASEAYYNANPNAGKPTPEEVAGMAGRVEIYECKTCKSITRFPRYNHPGKLLETRQGRCGEWANCFTLVCRATGFDARYILDSYTAAPDTVVHSFNLPAGTFSTSPIMCGRKRTGEE